VTISVVRTGDDLYVRTYRGTGGAWYRYAQARRQARIIASTAPSARSDPFKGRLLFDAFKKGEDALGELRGG
jgi:hypothetical protein